jgi:hypothetical protein
LNKEQKTWLSNLWHSLCEYLIINGKSIIHRSYTSMAPGGMMANKFWQTMGFSWRFAGSYKPSCHQELLLQCITTKKLKYMIRA